MHVFYHHYQMDHFQSSLEKPKTDMKPMYINKRDIRMNFGKKTNV